MQESALVEMNDGALIRGDSGPRAGAPGAALAGEGAHANAVNFFA